MLDICFCVCSNCSRREWCTVVKTNSDPNRFSSIVLASHKTKVIILYTAVTTRTPPPLQCTGRRGALREPCVGPYQYNIIIIICNIFSCVCVVHTYVYYIILFTSHTRILSVGSGPRVRAPLTRRVILVFITTHLYRARYTVINSLVG